MIHLKKLCVGIETVEQFAQHAAKKDIIVYTRSTPQQKEALLEGGSLYWIINGGFGVRQKIKEIRIVSESPKPCQIYLERDFVLTQFRPHRPFQGWRYLKPQDVPQDIMGKIGDENVDESFQRILENIGALRR